MFKEGSWSKTKNNLSKGHHVPKDVVYDSKLWPNAIVPYAFRRTDIGT